MKLKQLMKDGVDVTDLYTKAQELVALLTQANDIETLILYKEGEIRDLLEKIPKDENGKLTVDMMNGTNLVITEYTVLLEFLK